MSTIEEVVEYYTRLAIDIELLSDEEIETFVAEMTHQWESKNEYMSEQRINDYGY